MSDILNKIVATKFEEVAAACLLKPLVEIRAEAEIRPPTRDFVGAIRGRIACAIFGTNSRATTLRSPV